MYSIRKYLMRFGSFCKKVSVNHPVVDKVIVWCLIAAGGCVGVWMLIFVSELFR